MTRDVCRGKNDLERFRFQRHFSLHYPKERGPNGFRLCRWCGTECPSARRLWCSDNCVREYSIASGHSDTIQVVVERRDRGICALCGVDTAKLGRIVHRVKEMSRRGTYPSNWYRDTDDTADQQKKRVGRYDRQKIRYDKVLKMLYEKYPWAFHRYRFGNGNYLLEPALRSLWEADHIVPVSEGGGACGIDNFRTLCLPCHKAETAALRKRLAKAKK